MTSIEHLIDKSDKGAWANTMQYGVHIKIQEHRPRTLLNLDSASGILDQSAEVTSGGGTTGFHGAAKD